MSFILEGPSSEVPLYTELWALEHAVRHGYPGTPVTTGCYKCDLNSFGEVEMILPPLLNLK